MEKSELYNNQKAILLNDKSICKENRELFKNFFEYQEKKLKRQNGLSALDIGTYKTLSGYIMRFRNTNKWFNNKPWKDLTKEDIAKVYDDLEDGKILNSKGQAFMDRQSYYNKIFKSKPFQMVGKADLAREAIEYYNNKHGEVRFFKFEDFQKMIDASSNIKHKALFWLAFDVGENIESLLQLKAQDFTRQYNEDIKEYEYLINLHQGILKRSRTARGEPTLHSETVKLLDEVLHELDDEDLVFDFGYSNARKILADILKKTKVLCEPNKDQITWKDFRSSMACYLLNKNWTTDDINQRLGHKPSSRTLDKYVNFLAKTRRQPKKIFYASQIEDVKTENKKMQEQMQEMRTLISDMFEQLQSQQKAMADGGEIMGAMMDHSKKGEGLIDHLKKTKK